LAVGGSGKGNSKGKCRSFDFAQDDNFLVGRGEQTTATQMQGFFAALRMTAVRAMRREQTTAGATADPSTAAAKCAAFAQDDNFVVSCEL
jgi:hypothetical protein